MGRRATIIKHLKMMGYSIGEDSGSSDIDVVAVGLITDTGHMFMVTMMPEDFEKDFIIETVVGKINSLIQKKLKEVSA